MERSCQCTLWRACADTGIFRKVHPFTPLDKSRKLTWNGIKPDILRGKTAITAHRIKEITGTTITFTYKDYANGKKQKLMVLSHEEFARRFEQHILPKRFVKIRHGGYLAHNEKTNA